MTPLPSSAEPLARALRAVGQLIDGIQREQWSAPAPCTDWTVRELVAHLVGMNLVFAALLDDQPPPQRGAFDQQRCALKVQALIDGGPLVERNLGRLWALGQGPGRHSR